MILTSAFNIIIIKYSKFVGKNGTILQIVHFFKSYLLTLSPTDLMPVTSYMCLGGGGGWGLYAHTSVVVLQHFKT